MAEVRGGMKAEASALRTAFVLALAVLAVEAAGGFMARSLALLSDAAHMATDVGAAGLAWWAAAIALRGRDERRTYGYGRAGVLAAFSNAAILLAVVVMLVIEAVRRLYAPQPVNSAIMIAVAGVGLLANVWISLYLRGLHRDSLNVRGVIAHVAGDAVVSGGVLLAAGAILIWGRTIIDPLASLAACAVVAFSAWTLVRQSVNVLMEGAPPGLGPSAIGAAIRSSLPDVLDVHDAHVWSVADSSVNASLHVRVAEASLDRGPQIVEGVKRVLRDRFEITHATIEVECVDCEAACP
jgi:cobalt-zinc-cadmium efflux system protein